MCVYGCVYVCVVCTYVLNTHTYIYILYVCRGKFHRKYQPLNDYL